MALSVRTGRPAATSGAIIFRPDVADLATVTIAGQTITVPTDTTRQNCTLVPVEGLSPNTRYVYTVTCGADTRTGVLQTLPAANDESAEVRIAYASCMEVGLPHNVGRVLTASAHHALPHLFLDLGDYDYLEFARGWPLLIQQISTVPSDEDAYGRHYQAVWANPGVQVVAESTAWIGAPDDHQWPGNDVCAAHQAAPKGLNYYNTIATNQTEHDVIMERCARIYRYYYQGNPQFDNGETGPCGTLYYDLRAGSVHIIVLCCIPYRSIVTSTDNSSKTLIGTAQKTWLKATLAASTARHKWIFCPKQLYPDLATVAAGDGYGVFSTEREELVDFCHAQTGWARPGGVAWFCGDRHVLNVAYEAARRHLSITACPSSQGGLATGDGYNTHVIHRAAGYREITAARYHCYGYAQANGIDSARFMINSSMDQPLWDGTVTDFDVMRPRKPRRRLAV